MAKSKFRFEFVVSGEIEIESEIIDEVLLPDWQEGFYLLASPQAIADHLAYNLVCHRSKLTSLDGFAHRKESEVKVTKENWEAK